MSNPLRVVGLCGSLRAKSMNRSLLDAMVELGEPGLRITPWDWSEVPYYNGDIDADGGPPPVAALRDAVTQADALLVVTPEYNYGVPGALRNVLDWLSRPAFKSPLANKPIAHCGASPGAVGTARAQEQMKLFCAAVLARAMPYPGFLVRNASGHFSDGKLTDEETKEYAVRFLEAFEQWLRAG